MDKCHPTFDCLREETIDSLNVVAKIFEHKKTKAQHIHLEADSSENVFLVAFRTMPMDSTGVAHILEHTALCGSKRYPVRDPFFMMIRRSLNTFMNAFTASDWTAYPFATKNRKDFDNLLSVYLDATFFSRLDPLDFAQEGHRMELKEPDDLSSDLVYKGVVFNEMKGAMSSPTSILYDAVGRYLNPTNTYHYNSGGEPTHIPDLSYEQLLAFYKTHYHPSNATFLTYGDISAAELQQEFEEKALQHFEFSKDANTISVTAEKRYFAPITVTEHYALDANTPRENQTHHVMAWLLHSGDDLTHRLESQLLSEVLLGNSASPLRKALETFPGALSPSTLCGLEDSQLELSFLCGVEGSNPDQVDAFEKCVLDTLETVANKGVDQDQVESVLHQLELSQREISGDSYPYGLQLILSALTGATHRSDPIALLNVESALKQLREAIQDREYIPKLTKRLLLENQHRVRVTLLPDHTLGERRDRAEADQLAAAKEQMSEQALIQINEQAAALKARQETQEDEDAILPKVEISDIPKEVTYAKPSKESDSVSPAKWPFTCYTQGTNGLSYQQLVMDLPNLTEEQLDLLPIYTLCLGELGAGDKDYLEMQAWQARITGGVGASYSISCAKEDTNSINARLIVGSRSLNRNHKAMSELLQITFEQAKFSEGDRIKELVAQKRASMERKITGNGHSLAMIAASSRLAPTAKIHHELGGLGAIIKTKQLADSIDDTASLEALQASLESIHELIKTAPRQLCLISDAQHSTLGEQELIEQWADHANDNGASFSPFEYQFSRSPLNSVWLTNTQVNFCAKSFACVPYNHPDSAALTVLAPYLRNGYLHRVIREQGGAYGGGAGFANVIGLFRFYSYRDPRFIETLSDFDQSLQWLLNDKQDPQGLEQAILNVVSTIDKPGSPAGEAREAYHLALRGIDENFRRSFRAQVIDVTLDDLRRVAQQYLVEGSATSTAVISQSSTWETLKDKIDLNAFTV